MKRRLGRLIFISNIIIVEMLFSYGSCQKADNQEPTLENTIFETSVFKGGLEGPKGTKCYRIPSLIVTREGTLLAFIEGRPTGSDVGGSGAPIKLQMKRSSDNGRTWSDVIDIHTDPSFDYSDPRPILDEKTGRVFLFYTQWPDDCGQKSVPQGLGDSSSVTFLRFSDDDGLSWSKAINLNQQIKNPRWFSFNTGPGIGIQLKWQTEDQGNHNGRLIYPVIRRDTSQSFDVLSVFSDDGGVHWQTGKDYTTLPGTNESEIVELTDGRILLSCRGGTPARSQYVSNDGGETWIYTGTGGITMTRVDASMIRFSSVRDGDSKNRLLFSAPLGTPPGSGKGRANLGIWISYDEGKTFAKYKQVVWGFSAYSAMQKLKDGSIGVLYEASGTTLIRFIKLNINLLEKN